tara:strand:+ start:471 stop:710 length:240 start_codon:yes stop_codon:yes gene_type:complete
MSTAFDDRRRLRLLEQRAGDRDGIKAVEHYQALFPGHDDEVTAEWRSWTSPTSDGAAGADGAVRTIALKMFILLDRLKE